MRVVYTACLCEPIRRKERRVVLQNGWAVWVVDEDAMGSCILPSYVESSATEGTVLRHNVHLLTNMKKSCFSTLTPMNILKHY